MIEPQITYLTIRLLLRVHKEMEWNRMIIKKWKRIEWNRMYLSKGKNECFKMKE